ncbi:MAG: glycosyltransferase family 39 protein, partial [Candidatus Micrarchaeia archaeon]
MRPKPTYISYILLVAIITAYTLGTVQTFGSINFYLADEVWYPAAAYNYLKLIFGIAPNMNSIGYPNESGISTYMNFEHPPLGKYFMAISILALGYNPLAWRLPSWILGDLLLIAGFFLGEKLYEITTRKRSKSGIPGLLASLLIAIDPTIWVMHGVAMLDIYLAFFSLISLYALISKHYLWSGILLGLAALSKNPGFILYIPFFLYILKNIKSNNRRALYLLIPIAVYIELSAPLIFYVGAVQWFKNEFSNAVWETQGGHASFSTSSP